MAKKFDTELARRVVEDYNGCAACGGLSLGTYLEEACDALDEANRKEQLLLELARRSYLHISNCFFGSIDMFKEIRGIDGFPLNTKIDEPLLKEELHETIPKNKNEERDI